MSESSSITNVLETISSVLIRCFFIGVVFVSLWFLFFLLGGYAAYGMHSRLFQISRHEYDLLNYYGMAYMKISNFLLFLFPYIAIRMVMKKRQG